MSELIMLGLAFIAGALSSEGVRRTFNKLTGGRFFGKKKPDGAA